MLINTTWGVSEIQTNEKSYFPMLLFSWQRLEFSFSASQTLADCSGQTVAFFSDRRFCFGFSLSVEFFFICRSPASAKRRDACRHRDKERDCRFWRTICTATRGTRDGHGALSRRTNWLVFDIALHFTRHKLCKSRHVTSREELPSHFQDDSCGGCAFDWQPG